MKYGLKISVILILFLSICLFLMMRVFFSQRDELSRISKNQDELLSSNKKNVELTLTLSEAMKGRDSMINEISDKLKIKPKQINEVNNTYITNIDSSKTVYQSEKKNDSIFKLSISEKCWNLSGMFNSFSGKFEKDFFQYKDTIRVVDYWKRKKFLYMRIGRKEYFRESYSTCGSDIKTEKITFIKK